jgi:AcrR family transcriptional regulator
MTEKQLSILNSALKLFASKGFDAVPTSQIAKDAGVSEGLIFRHFQNKLGLLNAIMQMGAEKASVYIDAIGQIDSPAERIQAVIELPFQIDEDEYPFWRLVYSLKWQNEYYDDSLSQPLKDLLMKALDELKYPDASAEADLIMAYMDGFATTLLLKKEVVDKEKLLNVLRKKYIS